MAKSGVDYFPLDVTLNDNFKLIEAEFGLTGFGVVVKLYQKIYGGRGYYTEWTNEVALLFAREIGLGGNAVSEIVRASIKRGIFDETLYEKYGILTSEGIQRRYFKAVSRRKEIELNERYLLVPHTLFSGNVCNSEENVCNFEKNVCNFEQRKEEESKGKESKYIHHLLPRERAREIFIKLWERVPSEIEVEKLSVCASEFEEPEELLCKAMEIATEANVKTTAFVLGIFRNFTKHGIKNVSDLEAHERERERKKQGNSPQQKAPELQQGPDEESALRLRELNRKNKNQKG